MSSVGGAGPCTLQVEVRDALDKVRAARTEVNDKLLNLLGNGFCCGHVLFVKTRHEHEQFLQLDTRQSEASPNDGEHIQRDSGH